MTENNSVQMVKLPGSEVYLVNADDNDKFEPCSCEDGKVNFESGNYEECDYYEVDGKFECPDSEAVTQALNNVGLTSLFGNNFSALSKLLSKIPDLLEKLNDKDPNVQETAAYALGDIGDKAAVSGLLDALKNDEDHYVREAVAWALGKIGGESAIQGLLDALKSDVRSKKVVNVHVDFFSSGGFSCESSENVYNFAVEAYDLGKERAFRISDYASIATCADQGQPFLPGFKECPSYPLVLKTYGGAYTGSNIPKEAQAALASILICAAAEFSEAGDFDTFYEVMKLAAKFSVGDL